MDINELSIENLEKKIAGEIVLSSDPGKTIQKWRNIFGISQRTLADHMNIMPSVISDYENSRRKSPGIKIINKIVKSMIEIDKKNGGKIIHEFEIYPSKALLNKAIIDMKEFTTPIKIKSFCNKLDANIVVRKDLCENKIYGYTVIDSLKAILNLSPNELVKLYGLTTERALIFLGSHSGKTVMVALKVTNLKPRLVVLQGANKVDDLAARIGEIENICIAKTNISNNNILNKLKYYKKQ
ncbi:MAG: helix-turn-helix domain-containing protein [Candidatus Aenigmarchaeota archaeon]|nr:helix-turn-helix domain-containing protein [Candidatus Aenigmarchaeota archaeon]